MLDNDKDHATRLRRLRMRSMRRGIKEMDLILHAFASAHLAQLDGEALDRYETLLNENDQDLLSWIVGQTPVPQQHSAMIAMIAKTLPLN